MYKSPKENFSDFYNQVFEKENDAKANNTTVKKSYFQYNNNDISVRIPHDTVIHSDKKHNLSEPEWTDILNNILNIENAGISKTQYSNDNVALLKISTPNGKYGVSIQFANGINQISTVFKSTDKGIDEWIKKGSANSSTSEPLTSQDKSHTVAVVSQNPNNIISYVKEKLNPKTYFQSAITAGAEENEISDAKKEWEEKGVDSKYFKKWFGDSKVVDEDGKPNLLTDDKEIYITDGYSNNGISRYSYKGSHRSPSYSGGDVQERLENSEDVNLEEVAQGFHHQPDDYFSPMGARYYMYDDKEGLESARAVKDVIAKIKNGKENITVKIYRAVPADVVSDKLKNGDWVTLSKSYAIEHGEQNLDGEYKIIEKEVPINEVWWDGNDLREWGYDNGKEQEADLYLKIENPKYQDVLPANWKEARELRNQGYDGIITPKGEYLVFEKTQIKSVDNRGTFDETNPNIYYQTKNNIKVKPIEVELGSVPNQKSVSDVKKWIIENLNLLGDITVKTNGRVVKFSKGNIDRSMKDIGRNEARRNSYSKLKELVENSFHDDTDIKPADEKHKNVSHQELYYNAITYNGRTYGVEISVDIPKSEKTPNTYAGHKVKVIEMESSALGVHQKGTTNGTDSNISINDIRGLFNPKVKILYQSAYHGGAKDFDIFDLSYALSGEGAMAHGYGVYTAKNKEVSEGYRKKLTNGYSSTQYEYKNKTYTVLYDGIEDLHIKEDTSNLNKTEKDLILDLAISDSQEELLEELKDTKQNYEEEIVTVVKNGKSEEYTIKDYDKERYNSVLNKIKILESGEIKIKKEEGQLYKVDIPEDDVLLDEDKLLGDMILKEGLIDKLLDWANENGLYYQIDLTKSGAEIYDAIANKLGSDKLASEKLNELGFKGIKYNGREDGECYVIFDDKAIQILKTYYQSANGDELISNYNYIHNQVTGEKIDIELNNDIKVEKIEPQEVSSSLPFEISKKPSDNKKALIKSLNVNDGNSIKIKNIQTKETVKINKGTIEKSLSNVNISAEYYNDFCSIIYNISELFKNSQKILSYNDVKTNKSTKIRRYANIAKINNNEYLLEFTTKDNGEIALYSVNLLNKKAVLPNAYASKNFSATSTANNSIAHIQDVFKSKLIKKYKDYDL